MDEITSFGAWLRRRRKALDLTQADLADRAGCVAGTIKSIEADARRPSRQLAERLADQLELRQEERTAFLKAARAELSPDQLASPTQLMGRTVDSMAVSPPADASLRTLPTGTVTFLFTDIEGSTQLWEQHPTAMRAALARHDAILTETIADHQGKVVKMSGDGVLAAFAQPLDALATALAIQRALQTQQRDTVDALRLRMALHTGTAEVRGDDYFGPPLNRAARLMSAGHGGQILLSRAAVELVADDLPADIALRDLGMHRLKDLTRPEHIFELVAPDLPAGFPPLKTLDQRHTNLPAQPTALIGRTHEVALLSALLRGAGARLVTLTGPGGTGKTRLAVQVAAELLDAFADGVWFVDLAPLSDPELVIPTIMQTLALKEIGGQPPLEQLKTYLRGKQLLLVIDNFEQVAEAAPHIAALLAAAPQLKVLVTSRVILRLRGEQEFGVPPLALPDLRQLPPLEVLSQYSAVALFIERAHAAKPDFSVTNANAPAVAEICYQLDGLPLAIELAAARIKIFSSEALLRRLSNRLPMLTGGPHDLPARQKTLRTTIDWSYQLLGAGERRLFAWLAVFVGGCTLQAAEAICIAADDPRSDVLDGLVALVEQSLLQLMEGENGESRFVMLETIREYAVERLEASGEASATRQQHAEYYLALAERAEPKLVDREQPIWLDRLERERENLRAAMAWALAQEDTRIGLQLARAMGSFWNIRGPVTEGRRWLASALRLGTATPGTIRAKALSHASYLALIQNDYIEAAKLCEASLALYQDLGDQRGIATGIRYLGIAETFLGNYTQAEAVFAEALHLYRNLEDTYGIAAVLQHLGLGCLIRGDFPKAHLHLTESVMLFRRLELPLEIGESLTLAGITALLQGSKGDAGALLTEGLTFLKQVSDKLFISTNLLGLAGVAVSQLQPQRAACLFGAEEALRASVGFNRPDSTRPLYDLFMAAARSQIDEMTFAAAWAEGQAMTLEQAIAYALEG